jgi:quercetin dioxygenase-like cupin family protein
MRAKIGIALAALWLTALASPAAAAEPETLNVLGIQMTIKLDAEKTGGAMTVIESVVQPGGGPPMHIHSKEDELFYVLEGRFKLWHGDMVMDVGAGDVAYLKRNGRHTYQNVGATPGRLLTVITPAGFEGFFREVAKRGLSAPKDMPELNALAGEYGLQFVGPPPRAN